MGRNGMSQISLFAEETRLEKLSKLGDCLERLNIIDWFAPSRKKATELSPKREQESNTCSVL